MKLPIRPGLLISLGFGGLIICGIWYLSMTRNDLFSPAQSIMECFFRQTVCSPKYLSKTTSFFALFSFSFISLAIGLSLPERGSISMSYVIRLLTTKAWIVFWTILLSGTLWTGYMNTCPLVPLGTTLSQAVGLNQTSDLCATSKFTNLNLSNQGGGIVNGLQYFVNLAVLDLSHNQIWRSDHVFRLHRLKSLDLSHNDFHRIGLYQPLHNLIELNLSHNEISRISNLTLLPNLRSINLEHNKLKSLRGLVNSLEFVELDYPLFVYLKGNPLSENTLTYDVPRLPENVILVF